MGGPTRFVTLYVKGGWYPTFLWCPYGSAGTSSEVARQVTGLARPDLLEYFSGEPGYFAPNQVVALGTGAAYEPNPGATRMPIRVGRQWNPANVSDRSNGFSPLGASWARTDRQRVAVDFER